MREPTADFTAYIFNCLVMGERRLDLTDGGWIRGLIRVDLGGRSVELRQHEWVIRDVAWRDHVDQWQQTTELWIPKIAESQRNEAIDFAEKLAVLLGFATASEVGVAGWHHPVGEQIASQRSTTGKINYFSPVIDTRDGAAVRQFLQTTWAGFSREHGPRRLAAVFHYLALAEREGTPVEMKLAILFIVLEQLKHSYAVTNGYVFFKPWFHLPGTTKPTRATRRGFEKLIQEMFASAGMTPSLGGIADVRNEILHSGLSARDAQDLFSLQGDVLSILREYILRLIGYAGLFYTGQSGGTVSEVV